MNNIPANLNHLIPAYWMNIGFVMTNVKDNMQNNLRKKCGRVLDDMDDNLDKHDALNVIFTEIFKIIEEHNINTDELIQ